MGSNGAATGDMETASRLRSVLIVEDTPAVADLLASAISMLDGVQTTVVHDAAEALELIQGVKTDLVVLDVLLPGISGLELYQQLKRRQGFEGKVVFITADREALERLHHSHQGDAVLAKPFDINDVCDAVEQLLSER